jgi:hypothetical protein
MNSSMQITLLQTLLAEASKLPESENPFAGSVREEGDVVIGSLLPDEIKLSRLACAYHDKATTLTGGRTGYVVLEDQEENNKLGYASGMNKLIQELVRYNIMQRLNFEQSERSIGYLEDGSIVLFTPKVKDVLNELDIHFVGVLLPTQPE